MIHVCRGGPTADCGRAEWHETHVEVQPEQDYKIRKRIDNVLRARNVDVHRTARQEYRQMTTKTTTALTRADILRGYFDDRWLGYGYLGTRQIRQDATDPECPAVTEEQLLAADEAALAIANEKAWNYDRLFEWLNSKLGRWYGEDALWAGADVAEAAKRYVERPR